MTTTTPTDTLFKEISQLREENHYLKEQLEWFRRQVFGKRSEKIVANLSDVQLEFEGFDCTDSTEPPKKQSISSFERSKPKRDNKDKISLPEDLPIERTVLDLSEKEKTCSETGLPLVKIGEEVTRKLANRPGSYYIKEIVRFKYAHPSNSTIGISTPALPEGLLTRCQADESFLADILVKKFGDHLPLYRITEILGRQKIMISRQTLSQWVIRAGQALKPLYDEMLKHVLQSGNVFADETPIDMLDPGKGKTHQAYMWVLVGGKESNPPYRVYNFRTSRRHSNATELLKEYRGILHSDKYGAYESLANAKRITWCPCWVHIRRKFLEESGDPEFRKWVLRKIRYLFMLESVAWARSPEERLRIRQTKEVPILDELIKAIKARMVDGRILPKSKFKEALGYFCSLIPHLKNYTLDPWARIDNNVAERAIRPLAIGRKNWMFVGSEDGGESAAVIFTLVQSCRAIGINPREYLEDVMRRLLSHNSQKLHELLPNSWKKL